MGKRIAILTSGGDAPGMNAAISAIVRKGLDCGHEMFVVYDGFLGLVNGDIKQVDRKFVSGIINKGGTVIRTARYPEFADVRVQKKAVKVLEENKIDVLIGIGGDGTYHGLLGLHNCGAKVIGLPGTIDNDIATSDETIGFNTALNTICDALEKLKDTSSSHCRCAVVEVMGRYCADLSIYAAIAESAECLVCYDHIMPDEELFERIRKVKERKSHCLVVVSENLLDINELANKIEEATGFEAKPEVLGRLQRGGDPCPQDRILAARLGCYSIDLINQGVSGVVVGTKGTEVAATGIKEGFELPRTDRTSYFEIADVLGK
ncbi:MAG: 6-phosphofructokinase [Coprobacillus sp.]|nr:6-phosphofructokinase [Coprobacillus sp.]